LRAGREKMGLTVLQVAERIHTDPKIVEALEAENYPALGAPVYARGHIRHYAELVGEPATELIALYSDSSKVGQPDLTQIVKAPSAGDSSKLVAPALVVIAVFAVAGAVWWVSSLSKKKPQMSETHVLGEESSASPSSASQSAPGSADGSAQASGQSPSGAASGAAGSPSAGAGAGGQNRPGSSAPGGVPGLQGRSGSAASSAAAGPQGRAGAPTAAAGGAGSSGLQSRTGSPVAGSGSGSQGRPASPAASPPPTRVASAAPGTAGTSTPVAPPPAPSKNQAQVTLRYSADSWTEVYDASGARLYYDVGAANSVQSVVGTPPLRVVLGNASGVAVEFNGRSTPIAKLAHPDGSVQFSINRSGRVIRAKPVADGG